jgi:hypothetical protein
MRMRCLLMTLLNCLVVCGAPAAEDWQAAKRSGTRFVVFDVVVDSGTHPLAAWQLDIRATKGSVKIAGIEGGEHPAFKEPPHHDPKAIQRERVKLAAFSTAAADSLPRGRTRVATLHVQVTGSTEPQFEVRVEAGAQPGGTVIKLKAEILERKSP